MIRLLLLVIVLILFVLLSLPLLLLCCIIGIFSIPNQRKTALFLSRIWGKLLLFVSGTRVTVTGRENVPKGEALLFVGNHRSLFDIPMFYAYTPRPAGFIAKKELNKIPILNWWMRCLGCLFLDRSTARAGAKTILTGIERIRTGESLFIFPEGTRSSSKEMGHFKPGSMKLAEKSGCTIIPIAMVNTDQILETSRFGVQSANCKLLFGDPIRLEELAEEDRRNLSEYTKGKIQELIRTSP